MAGGRFHAVTDDQLKRLLAGDLAPAGFLAGGGGEQPRETYAKAEEVWYELSQVLQAEAACGAAQTDRIPEMLGYSSAQQAKATADKLAVLGDAEIRTRCDGALMDATPDQVLAIVQELKAFFQRAAANQDAVVFHVT